MAGEREKEDALSREPPVRERGRRGAGEAGEARDGRHSMQRRVGQTSTSTGLASGRLRTETATERGRDQSGEWLAQIAVRVDRDGESNEGGGAFY